MVKEMLNYANGCVLRTTGMSHYSLDRMQTRLLHLNYSNYYLNLTIKTPNLSTRICLILSDQDLKLEQAEGTIFELKTH